MASLGSLIDCREVDTLYRLVSAGVRAPKPYGYFNDTLIMELRCSRPSIDLLSYASEVCGDRPADCRYAESCWHRCRGRPRPASAWVSPHGHLARRFGGPTRFPAPPTARSAGCDHPTGYDVHVPHIHIITPCVTPQLRNSDDLSALEREGVRVSHSTIAIGPASIESEYDAALCVPGTIQSALQAQSAGADAIIVDCMGDPGVNACRELLAIPVFGPGQTSMHVAAMIGLRFGVVTVVDSVIPMIENLASVSGLERKLCGVRSVNIPVLEIDKDPQKLEEALLVQCERAVLEDGAHAIVLGCTGFFGCAKALTVRLEERHLSVPVIDPIATTLNIALALLAAGVGPSRRTYPAPRAKPVVGFDLPARADAST